MFDETNLFDPNRSPGFDIYDSGARLNFGGRATIQWGDGREARAFIGAMPRPEELMLPLAGLQLCGGDLVALEPPAPVTGVTDDAGGVTPSRNACAFCGHPLPADALFCAGCGAPAGAQPEPEPGAVEELHPEADESSDELRVAGDAEPVPEAQER